MLNIPTYLIMSNVKERLSQFIKFKNMSVVEFERLIGVSNGYVSSISKSIQPDKLEIISDTNPDLSIEWLLIGRGSMLKSEQLTSIQQRLEHFIEKEKINLSEFCKIINFPLSQFDKFNGIISEDRLKKITENYPQLSIEWLMSGDGEMLKLTQSKASYGYNTPEPSQPVLREEPLYYKSNKKETRPRIPLTAAAGSLSDESIGVTLQQCEQLPIIHQIPAYDFTMFIKGDSMSPRFESGDEIACRRIDQSRFIQWGKVHVLDTTQGILIKRVYEDGDKIRCVSYNPNYSDFSVSKEDILSMSLVVGLVSIMEM